MRTPRLPLLHALLALLLGGLALPPAVGAVGGWTPTAPRPSPDDAPAASTGATTLADGRVLVAESHYAPTGGVAELYDPAADRWTEAAPFDPNNGRATPTLLHDGRVLFIGGVSMRGISPSSMIGLATAQAYDPATGTWTPVAPMRDARREHTATLLLDGTVLVVSGDSGPPFYSPRPVVGVERYDPRTNRWSDAEPLARARSGHGAAPLRDGRVLVFGGYGDATAEIYDPAADRWSRAADLPWGKRYDYAGHGIALPDGRVLALALGGSELTPAVAVYDPVADRWTLAPPPPPRTLAFSPLPGGRLLAIGEDARIYDPALNAWAGAPSPADPRMPQSGAAAMHRATMLRDGRVLLVGERGGQIYASDPAPRACFAETGQCVGGRFLTYWQDHGGLARNGFPLSDVRVEVLEDGNAYQVQYFERVRLEYHPENAAPYDVLLGQFGRTILNQRLIAVRSVPQPSETTYLPADARQPADPKPGQTHFGETRHNLGGRFRDYWQANGGLAQFGFPLTEEVEETLEDGKTYRVQYFERARFEYHPENTDTPYEVLLGQFGREILAQADRLSGDFGLLYATQPAVRGRLGAPSLPTAQEEGATQEFERGRMFYRRAEGIVGQIYVLCGEPQAGRLIGHMRSYYFFDTWTEGQDPGGGAAPTPGLFSPQRGFGKVWRDNPEVRACLGYARTANETGYTIAAQQFQNGLMLSEPEARFIYVITIHRPCFDCEEDATYERYGVPAR